MTLSRSSIFPLSFADGPALLLLIGICAGFSWSPAFEYPLAGITLAAITAAAVFSPLSGRPFVLPTHRGGQIALMLLTALTLLGWGRAFTSDIPALSLLQAGFYSLPLLAAIAVLNIPGPDLPRHLLSVLGGMFFLIGIAAPIQVALFDLPASDRAQWPLQDPNHLAMILNTGIILGLAIATNTKTRLIGLSIMAVDLVGLLLTGSRAGFLFLLAASPLLLIGIKPRFKIKWGLLALGAGFIGLAALILQMIRPIKASILANLLELFTDPEKASGTRLDMWADTLHLIGLRPLTGFGTGTFPAIFPQVMRPIHTTSGYAAHNDTLQIGAELGLPGLILYLVLGLTLLIVTIHVLRQKKTEPQIHMLMASGVLFVVGLHGQIEYMLGVLPVLCLWGAAFGVWLRSLPTQPDRPASIKLFSRPLSQAIGLSFVLLTLTSLSQLYAEILLKRSTQALTTHRVAAFAHDLDQAQFWSWHLNAQPYLRAAHFHLGLLLSGNPGGITNPQTIQDLIHQALQRNPYLPGAYETQGHLDNYLGQSPESSWQHAIALDPRQAGIRLTLMEYYARTGQDQKLRALIDETFLWRRRMKGPIQELGVFTRNHRHLP